LALQRTACGEHGGKGHQQVFKRYKKSGDFVGMDMARKFLQMGYTRARRYANHATGRKYDAEGDVPPCQLDRVKAESARSSLRPGNVSRRMLSIKG
jgi:hypothetical protein